jgi:hypothetical protein
MPGSPSQNDMAKRRNQTLMDMVRSMISNSDLLFSLWSKAIKIMTCALNRVLTKMVDKTHLKFRKARILV